MRGRGPDGGSQVIRYNVGLGQLALHATPESRLERLPLHDTRHDLLITADARLDNRKELADLLSIRPVQLHELGDAELILQAYLHWQEDCVNYLVGDFAFVIWDSEQQAMFCARDHLGVKPFYYHLSDRRFVFASLPRAVANVPGVPGDINEARIADYLLDELEGYDLTSTFYRSVVRLPPAHCMLVNRKRARYWRYWRLTENEIRLTNDDAYLEAFNELLDKAIAVRTRGNIAFGLSGGVDSSTILGRALRLQPDQVPAVYSGVAVNSRDCVETRHIRQIVERGGLSHHACQPDQPEQYADSFSAILPDLQEPFDGAMLLNGLLYGMVRNSGHRALIDGVEGDMVHSLPSNYVRHLVKSGNVRTALGEIGGSANGVKRICSVPGLMRSTLGLFMPSRLQQRRRHRKILGGYQHLLESSLIDMKFAEDVDAKGRYLQLAKHGVEEAGMRAQHIRQIEHPYLTVALERYDRLAGLYGVEPRHPLLDKRLVEFVVAIPWNQKRRQGWSKYLLRRAGKGVIPQSVSWRRDWEHLGWQFCERYMQYKNREIQGSLDDAKALLSRYLNPRRSNRWLCDDPDTRDERWHVYILANWLQHHSDSIRAS